MAPDRSCFAVHHDPWGLLVERLQHVWMNQYRVEQALPAWAHHEARMIRQRIPAEG
jgi:hypothetical protein